MINECDVSVETEPEATGVLDWVGVIVRVVRTEEEGVDTICEVGGVAWLDGLGVISVLDDDGNSDITVVEFGIGVGTGAGPYLVRIFFMLAA